MVSPAELELIAAMNQQIERLLAIIAKHAEAIDLLKTIIESLRNQILEAK